MRGQYLAAIKARLHNGNWVEGNKPFFTDGEALTMEHLDRVKELYSRDCAAEGFIFNPKKAVIYAVIPLDQ